MVMVDYYRSSSRMACRYFNERGGFGFIVNVLVGIAGAVIGGWVFGLLGIAAGGIMGSLVTALVGAVLLLWIISLFQKKSIVSPRKSN